MDSSWPKASEPEHTSCVHICSQLGQLHLLAHPHSGAVAQLAATPCPAQGSGAITLMSVTQNQPVFFSFFFGVFFFIIIYLNSDG